MTGYLHPSYVESLAEFGRPFCLPKCGGYLLVRTIAGTEWQDAMGPYPLFVCRDWTRLSEDLADLGRNFVSISAVLDPFGDYEPSQLSALFPDAMVAFKEHYVVDLNVPFAETITKHHRYYAKKAMRDVQIEICDNPLAFLDEWAEIYECLCRKHGIRGIRAFSKTGFAAQLALPGLVLFIARHQGAVVGAHLWYQEGNVAYSHLAACNDVGYSFSAAYALYWAALHHFTGKVRWMELGGGSGAKDATGGLTQFKQGWSTGTRTVYFCGRILDRERYAQIVAAKNSPPTQYFPAYRQGEFA